MSDWSGKNAVWVCRACGAENTDGAICHLCGATRTSRDRSKILPMICNIFFVILFGLVLGLLGLLWGMGQYDMWRALDDHGVRVMGRCTEKYMTSGVDAYTIGYSYGYKGQIYTIQQSVSQDIYNRVEIGGQIDIKVLPEHPAFSKPVENPATPNFFAHSSDYFTAADRRCSGASADSAASL
ncbi:MAG TPA: hypothetical protein VHO69_10910 [Phototrophicaceae bacterium]|nr:hypothetical protein [Phototrophicaceae bacterium]